MIIVLAKAIPKDDDAKNEIIEFSADLVENSKAEKGNIDYNLYENAHEDSLIFVEKWESIEILQKHMQSDHFLKFGQNIGDLVSGELEIEVLNSEILEF
ncbi:MAG: antibiotic biosynthesis monooxygenase [Methanobrevibacter sp.]|nr:antibiotic biosynthesis monooxygenase [Methanobrevibacter sp.]